MASPLLEPIRASDWDRRKARHLLNRAGFGLTHDRLDRITAMSPAAAVDYFVDFEAQPEPGDAPDFLIPPLSREELRRRYANATEEERRKARNEYQQQERVAIQRLKAWWLHRMFTTERPLQEKLALFWHGHFATSAQKVKSSWHTHQLNDVFRRNAAGNFKRLTFAVGQSPSMLRYLDNVQSTKKHPNENWARELMELFTMGKGNYTEDDIKNSARAFTGWSADHEKFVYREDYHDIGEKVFLGRRGDFDGWDIVDIIFEQPATSQFMAKKLWTYFAYENPEPELVDELANTLRQNNFELRPMLRQMFMAQAFYSDKAVAQQIKSPVQTVLQLASDLDYDSPPFSAMAQAAQRLGQDIFFPPNVKGWDGGRAWINANTLLVRYNLPGFLVTAKLKKEDLEMMAYLGQAGLMSQNGEPSTAPQSMMSMTSEADAGSAQPQWNAQTFFASMKYATPNDCVSQLENRFLSTPLSADQRAVLIRSLGVDGDPAAPLGDKPIPQRFLFATLHLLLSTAEYQLC
ncbi:MAG: DUF1800 domain-containing protein [Candidatus Hydrogenedentes bacterium]|nr:DUF1800 domain-containing protein [Candidatus Hydrogenedentota bacterium]